MNNDETYGDLQVSLKIEQLPNLMAVGNDHTNYKVTIDGKEIPVVNLMLDFTQRPVLCSMAFHVKHLAVDVKNADIKMNGIFNLGKTEAEQTFKQLKQVFEPAGTAPVWKSIDERPSDQDKILLQDSLGISVGVYHNLDDGKVFIDGNFEDVTAWKHVHGWIHFPKGDI